MAYYSEPTGLRVVIVRLLTMVDGDVARSVRAPNSNRKVASSMPTLGVTRCCVLGKDFKR